MTGPIERAKHGHRLADVARRTGITVPAGSGTCTVRCPMPAHGHPDRTPSLRLYLDDDRYFCFGCGVHGDVVQWARDAVHLDISAALRLLESRQPIPNAWVGRVDGERPPRSAAHAGGPDPARTPPERVLAAIEAAWTHYSSREPHRAGATYLAGRGIDIGILEQATHRAEVGLTLGSQPSLSTRLRSEGFAEDELVDAGLSRRSLHGSGLVDAYRRRVLIPIRTARGDVCAIVGRNVGDPHAPKYLNPPRTAVYDKSTNLYAPLPVPTDRRCRAVVVEGTIDAIALATTIISADMAGRLWPVTQSGRELSSRQIDRILSVCGGPPLLALDADDAGREATERIAAALATRGVVAGRACLPEDQDPASWFSAAAGSSSGKRRSLSVLTGAVAHRAPEIGAPGRQVDL